MDDDERDELGVGPTLDSLIGAVARAVRKVGLPTPTNMLLAEDRERAARSVLRQLGRELDGLAERGTEGNGDLAQLAERALVDMRAEVRRSARSAGALATISVEMDERWRDTNATEHLDDPSYDAAARARIIEHLDETNQLLGSYESFFDALRPLLRSDRTTRVLDLAAGHGGFLLACARIAKREGIALELTATDIKPEYLEIGAERAELEGLDVRFREQDALDLRNLAAGEADVIVSTQSLHHFPPGLVAVLAAEAARTATLGVVLIDGARSRANGAAVPALGLARWGDLGFAHDALVSLRRFFVPEELGLLARIGARAAGLAEGDVEARWLPPGHCLARLTKR